MAPGDGVSLGASEAGGRVEVALDGGPLRPAAAALQAPAAGEHWLAVASRDGAGNLSPVTWYRLRVDGEAPQVSLAVEPAPVVDATGARWVPPRAMAMAIAEDAMAGVVRTGLAFGDVQREEAGATVEAALPATAGTVTLRAWAEDGVGNRAPDTTLAVTVDAMPPAGSWKVTGPHVETESGLVLGPGAALVAEIADGESGLAGWTPHIDGAAATEAALAGPWSAGTHRVEALAEDRVGHRATIGPLHFMADEDGPEIQWRLVSPASRFDGEAFYQPPVVLALEVSDAPAGVDVLAWSADGDTFQPMAATRTLEVDGDRVLLRARDRVGNSRQVEARWRVDDQPPEIVLRLPNGTTAAAGATLQLVWGDQIVVQASDAGVGIEGGLVYAFDQDRPRSLTDKIELQRVGTFELMVEGSDRLGNRRRARWTLVVGRRVEAGGSQP